MKRLAVLCMIMIGLIIMLLCRTAIDPMDFSGEWYSSEEQNIYLFQDGLIYCEKFPVALSDSEYISGAYTICKDSVFLFAAGIPGLETEKELYLINRDDGSFLYENRDGTGKVYFIRYHK